MNKKVFIFIGKSGSGKGTQAKLLIEKLGQKSESVYYVSTGDEFRRVFSMNTYSSNLVKGIVDQGLFCPSFAAVSMWTNALFRDLKENEHIIIDGTPRSVSEAMVLDTLFPFYEAEPVVIYIDVTREWATEKLLGRARHDDTNDGITSRLDLFDSQIVPIVDMYKSRESIVVHHINGEQAVEAVHKDLMTALEI
ncbi:MAG: adk, adenylate kinase, adenylate kinase [Candidatus Taylorbacteria bacterium]|nr:adk, adenylate kinase, adenylate kinase [Candidatus Taylorbacteria bacterium]